MRMRKKKHLDERLERCNSVNLGWVQDYASELKGENPMEILDFSKVFGNNNPVHLEIGCGKGRFVREIAKRNPNINFVAVEQNRNVIVKAMEDTIEDGLANVKYIMGMADYLEKMIAPTSVERIYLNFSCPYPKSTYAKHRLTHGRFLSIYRNLLKRDGDIIQKTDNKGLFEFSLVSYSENDWLLKKVSLDLHNSDVEGNIMTEYEERFTLLGMPIYYLEACCK